MTRTGPDLTGKVALITGSARGLGRAIAVALAGYGADIVICDVDGSVDGQQYGLASRADLDETKSLVEAAGGRCLTGIADVRDQAALDGLVADACAAFGHIDIVCANAGLVSGGMFWELTEQQWQDVMDVNLTGVWHVAKAVAPHMIARASGSIVVISSTNSRIASAGASHYTASKHAVIGLMKAMALELGGHGIRVNAVAPSRSDTNIIKNKSADHHAYTALRGAGLLPPSAVAEAVAWLVSDAAAYVTGIELPVDAGRMLLPPINLRL